MFKIKYSIFFYWVEVDVLVGVGLVGVVFVKLGFVVVVVGVGFLVGLVLLVGGVVVVEDCFFEDFLKVVLSFVLRLLKVWIVGVF